MKMLAERGKPYWSCEWLEWGLTFSAMNLNICCITHHNGLGSPQLLRPYNGERLDIEKLIEDRDKVTLKNQFPERYPACAGCAALKEMKWPIKKYPFDVINLSHWRKCNLRCSFCYTVIEPMPELDQTYQALPVMQQLVSEKAVGAGSQVYWGGGELTMLGEFDALFELFSANGMYQHLYTNGVLLSRTLRDALPSLNGEVMISIDAGTADTFRLLKKANAFDRVMQNLAEYAHAASDKVTAKFILKDENCKEVVPFLDHVEKAGVRAIRVDVDNHEPVLKQNIIDAGRKFATEGRRRGLAMHIGGTGDIGFPENEWKNKIAEPPGKTSNVSRLKKKINNAWNHLCAKVQKD
ncbi:MAG TPA: radical SAM protein [Syntrophorhabdus sp.]|nr:radical SAM protein [Syntrophorhabdus sp.]